MSKPQAGAEQNPPSFLHIGTFTTSLIKNPNSNTKDQQASSNVVVFHPIPFWLLISFLQYLQT